jgi:nucleotide-binding universal stress UspA family protein
MPITDFGKKILAAVDIRGDWTNVVRHAAHFARLSGASLHLVHVLEKPASSLERAFSGKDLKAMNRRLMDDAAVRMREALVDFEKEGIRAEVIVREGRPPQQVLEVAEEIKAGLIVVGAGASEDKSWLFVGTTPDRVIRASSVPILVVGTSAGRPIKRIMVPTDLDRADEGALRIAAKIGLQVKARVSIFNTFSQPSTLHRYLGNVAELRKEAKESARKSFDEFLARTTLPEGAPAPHILMKASPDTVHPAEAILAEASRLNMDLIVMALGGISFLQTFMIGHVAEKVIRQLPCNLLALPTRWARKR